MYLFDDMVDEISVRDPNDFYPTPMSIATILIDHLNARWRLYADYGGQHAWEPCCGDSRLSMFMQKKGWSVLATDITRGYNFFQYDNSPTHTLVTNPPFRYIRPFIDHAFNIGVERMALVCPERLWACGAGKEQWSRYRPSAFINMDWREDYLNKGGSPDRALAVSIWDRPHSETCEFDIWSRHDPFKEPG